MPGYPSGSVTSCPLLWTALAWQTTATAVAGDPAHCCITVAGIVTHLLRLSSGPATAVAWQTTIGACDCGRMANHGHCGAQDCDGAGPPLAGRANDGHCGASAADI